MPKTIAYFSNSLIPSNSANSVHTMKICAAFSEKFDNVILFSRTSEVHCDDKYKYYGVNPTFRIIENHWPNVTRFSGFFYGYRNLLYLKKLNSVSLLYGRNAYSLFLCRNSGIPIIFESHQIPKTALQQYMERKIIRCKSFKHVVVISKKLKELYLEKFPELSERKIVVAPDAADDHFSGQIAGHYLRGRKESIKVGYVGSLLPGRGVNFILELAGKCGDADFHIIGGNKREIQEIQNRTETQNVFFYGHKPHGALPGYFSELDILVAPYQKKVSVYGGKGDTSQIMSPLKIFEYMASGKAIIASNLDVLKEVLVDHFNAMLCDPEDINHWISTIRRLIDDDDLRNKLGNNARQEFLKKYTWGKRTEIVLNGLQFD